MIEARSTYQASLGFPAPGAYRRTPPGQPTVADLVRPGMTVRTSYGTGGIVVRVDGPWTWRTPDGEDYQQWSVLYVLPQNYGRHGDIPADHPFGNPSVCAVNELVAVDGRILALFECNDDELFVTDATIAIPVNRAGQMALPL